MKREYPLIDVKRSGQNIKHIMNIQGYTVKEVQEYLELGSAQSIYHWLEGKSMPTLDNLYALSAFFHVPVDTLLAGNRKYTCIRCGESDRRLFAYYVRLKENVPVVR